MSVLTASYKVVDGKKVEEFSAESKVSLLVCFAQFLAAIPEEADTGVSLLYQGNETTGFHPLRDGEIAAVIARMVEAVKSADNDVERAVKYLSQSTDVVAEYAGQLLGEAWQQLVVGRRRVRPLSR